MSRGNSGSNNNDIAATAATVAIGAAAVYGACKLFGSLFGSDEPPQQQRQPNNDRSAYSLESQMHSSSRPQMYKCQPNQDIYVVNTVEQCRYSIRELKSHCDEFNVLGFDCEWVSDYTGRRKVALLQLATHRGLCVLIRLCKLKHIPSDLADILNDKNIIKVGVAPYTDAKFLRDDYNCNCNGTLDLRFVAERAGCNPGRLSKMSDDYLGISLDKDSNQCSDWEADSMDGDQIEYAAQDVHVAIQLFKYFGCEIAPSKGSRYIINNYLSGDIDVNYGPQRAALKHW